MVVFISNDTTTPLVPPLSLRRHPGNPRLAEQSTGYTNTKSDTKENNPFDFRQLGLAFTVTTVSNMLLHFNTCYVVQQANLRCTGTSQTTKCVRPLTVLYEYVVSEVQGAVRSQRANMHCGYIGGICQLLLAKLYVDSPAIYRLFCVLIG
jgi:hypothetical protein